MGFTIHVSIGARDRAWARQFLPPDPTFLPHEPVGHKTVAASPK